MYIDEKKKKVFFWLSDYMRERKMVSHSRSLKLWIVGFQRFLKQTRSSGSLDYEKPEPKKTIKKDNIIVNLDFDLPRRTSSILIIDL